MTKYIQESKLLLGKLAGVGRTGQVRQYTARSALKIYHRPLTVVEELHLDRIIEKKNEIHLSPIPSEKIYCNNRCRGVKIPYYPNSIAYFSMVKRKDVSISQKVTWLRQIKEALLELNEASFYMTDLDIENVLYLPTKNGVTLIDTDDLDIDYIDDDQESLRRQQLSCYTGVVFDSLYPEREENALQQIPWQQLENDHMPRDFIDALQKGNISFPFYEEFLGCIEINQNEIMKQKSAK